MADISPQKEEEERKEENSFVESSVHSDHSNLSNESPLKEETIIDKVEEHIPGPVEARRTPSPSLSNHSQDVGNNVKSDEIPSSSNNHDDESPADPDAQKSFHFDQPDIPHEDPSKSGSPSHDVIPQKPPTPDISGTSNNDEVIKHERDPNDIEPEIKKVMIQGYTEDEPEEPQTIESNKAVSSVSQTPSDPKPPAAKSAQKADSTDQKKSFHFQKPAPSKPAPAKLAPAKPAPAKLAPSKPSPAKPVPAKTTVSNGIAAKRPASSTVPPRMVGVTEKRTTVSAKPTAASINAASKRLSAPLRPATTERKPFSTSVTKRTPSSNPRGTPKAPSTAPPRAMSATRSTLAKTENSAHATPIRNKKYENIQGKVNATSNYSPGGGNVKIFHEKPKFNVTSKIGSLQNANHTPGGGQVKIESRKFNFKENAKPKVDAKTEILSPHVEKKILTQKLEWKASPKVGSLANASHKPAGGDVKIFNQKVKVDAAQSKVGSLENANHKPAGGNVNIKEYKVPGNSSSNSVTSHSTGNSRRSSATRNRMPGCHDPITPEEALGRN